MAVPPLAAQIIIEAILKTFAGIEYPIVESAWEVTRGAEVTHLIQRKTPSKATGQHLLPVDVESTPPPPVAVPKTSPAVPIPNQQLPARNGADKNPALHLLDHAGQPYS